MSQSNRLPAWAITLFIVASLFVIARIAAGMQSDVGVMIALRTYVFWALVCAPVAYLADVFVRTVLDYRFVQLAVARVRSRR